MRHHRLALALALLLSANTALAQEPAADPPLPPPPPPAPPAPPATPAPEPRMPPPAYIYVPAPEDGAAPLRALRPKRVRPMRRGATLTLFDWSIAAPLGSVRDYAGDVSFRGVHLDVRYLVHRAVSLGVSAGWQLFDEKKERATYPLESGAITATFYQSLRMIPLLATVHVYPGGYGPVKPFLGLGVGTSYTYFETLAADLAWTKSEWFFTLQPEAGVLIGRDTAYQSFGLSLTARYTWLPATFGEVTNAQTLGVGVGLYSLF